MRLRPVLLAIMTLLALTILVSCHTKKGASGAVATAPQSAKAHSDGSNKTQGGALQGRVTDDSGQPIIGATIQVTGPNLSGFLGAVTDLNGDYRIPFLPVGKDYQAKVEAAGFGTVIRQNIEIPLGAAINLPFQISGGTTEMVISAFAPIIDSRKTEAGSVISNAMFPGLDPTRADVLLVMEQTPRDVLAAPFPDADATTPPPPTQGILRAQKITGEPLGDFPLQHTEVTADVGGYLVRTTVEQVYANPYSEVIEAVYSFPLGATAAVNDFVMEVAGRKIVGIVRPREEAERIYREARARGQTASLLTQERPNLFTQNVANIEPGGTVKVTLTTFERLRYEKGAYEYVFPMVVGPRYIPGGMATPSEPATKQAGGAGTSPATDVVPDADHITPPVLKPGERSGHDIGLTVHLEAGLALGEVTSVAHKVAIAREGKTRATVTLAANDTIPNRDFVLRWTVDASKMGFGFLAHREDQEGYFTLMVQPPLAPADEEVCPREITFILDVSGSMSGLPIETSKSLVREVLDRLRPEDAFNIFVFASGNGQLWPTARQGSAENILAAKAYLNGLSGGGGTEMLAGLRRAIEGTHDPKFLQMFVFCTDGYVGDETRILEFVKQERREARFFAFGIGNSVNRYLIEGIGAEGGGRSAVVMPRDEGHAQKAAEAFFACIDSPVLVGAQVEWGDLPVADVYPPKPLDLYAGGTLELVGRYTRPTSGTAYLTGRVGSRAVRLPVKISFPAVAETHKELAPVWARYKIASLSSEMLGADEASKGVLVQTITDLAVKHRLVSQYTAFVAVDASRIVGDGRPLKVVQPVELPEGVSYEGNFGEPPVGKAFTIAAWGLTLQATQSGALKVGAVEPSGPAALANLKPGSTLKAVNGTLVHDAVHLEGLLLQTPGVTTSVTFDPGGTVALPTP